jgi:hypothetical protein
VLVGFLTTSTVIWILFPIHAYQRNNDLTSIAGFQGMTNQSQVMGVLAAVSLAWVIAKIATDSNCKRWYWYLVGAGLLIFMIASNARTGPVCLTLAAVTTGVGALFFRRYRIKAILEIFKLRFWVAVTSFVVLIGLNFVKMRDAAVDFAIKGGRNGNEINAAFEASRGFRIRELYNSFLESPWTGKGFGLETFERNLQVVYDPLLGVIPIKASVEKNFIFLAIFEETGIFGGGIIILFIIATVYFLINYRSLLWCFVFLAGIFVNVGEAVLFSLGGMGLFVWVIMMSSLIRRPSGLGTPIQ